MPEGKMPQLPLPGEETLKLGQKYVILSVEEFKSDVQGFLGWRVTLDGGKDDLLAIPLWVRDIVGRSSKLGAFLVALGQDSDSWNGHIIEFVKWQPRDREIKVVK